MLVLKREFNSLNFDCPHSPGIHLKLQTRYLPKCYLNTTR